MEHRDASDARRRLLLDPRQLANLGFGGAEVWVSFGVLGFGVRVFGLGFGVCMEVQKGPQTPILMFKARTVQASRRIRC